MPFEPDKVCIVCFGNAVYNASERTIMQYVADLASVETVGSTSVHAQAMNVQMGITSIASTLQRCVYADGVLRATPYEQYGYIWGADAMYAVIAVKEG